MTQEEFTTLVQRLELQAQKDPSGYRFRVGALAGLGYFYIVFILAILLVILGGLAYAVFSSHRLNALILKVGWIAVALAFVIVRALWVKIPPPEGIPLRREEFPALFSMLDEMTTKLQAPRFNHVLLDDEFNAAVAQVPRLGIFGWQENYLLLGLPLMQGFTPRQFQAVVAHELGHLSANHSQFHGWIYRVRRSWGQLMQAFEESDQWGDFIFEKFLNWYFPYFNAYSFVLARQDEYIADRVSVELTDAKNSAEMLTSLSIRARHLGHTVWPDLYGRVNLLPEPPPAVYNELAERLRAEVPEPDARKWLREALSEETGYADTHPSLSDRLKGMGQLPEGTPEQVAEMLPLPSPPVETAARYYLGSSLEPLSRKLSDTWREQVSEEWASRHRYIEELKTRMAALEEKLQREPLTDEEAWEYAEGTRFLKDDEAALPLYRSLLERQPDHAGANFHLGRILLERDDPDGLGFLDRAMEHDPEAVPEGCRIAYTYLMSHGRHEEAEPYLNRAEQHFTLIQVAHQERDQLNLDDVLVPHGLNAEQFHSLQTRLSRLSGLKTAYLVRKEVQHYKDVPVYVLGYLAHRGEDKDGELRKRILEEADEELEGSYFVLPLIGPYGDLLKPMKKIEGSQIYPIS